MQIRTLTPVDAVLHENAATEVFDPSAEPKLAVEFLSSRKRYIAATMAGSVVATWLWINNIGVAESNRGRAIAKRLRQVPGV